MAKMACLPMFGRKYKVKNVKPDHLPYNDSSKKLEVSLLVSPECAPVGPGHVRAGTVENVVWEGNMVERPTFEETRYDVGSPVSDEDGRVDNLKVDVLHSSVGEAEYEGGDEADKDAGVDQLVKGHCEQRFESGHLVSGQEGDGCEKEVQDYYESPESIPSCLTERSCSEIDIQSGHVSDPGTQWATLQSLCEPLARSRSGGFSETKAFEENESCGHRFSDYSLNSGQVDATYVPSGLVVPDYGSFVSGDKTSTVRDLSHKGFASTRSEGSAPTAGDGVFFDMRLAGNGIMLQRTRKPWWKVTLRAHRSIPTSSNNPAKVSQSSRRAENAMPRVQGGYGSDGDVSAGIVSPESVDLMASQVVGSTANFREASESGNAVHIDDDVFMPHFAEPMQGGGDANGRRADGVLAYLLSPPHLNGFQGCNMSAFPAKHRVEEWISKIDLTLPVEDELLPPFETPFASGPNGKVDNFEDSRVRQHKDLESVQASAPPDVDMALALAAARTLHPLATVALFPGVGLKTVPPLVMFNLKTINLSANALTRILPGCFPKSVHHLDLSRNKIVAIEGLRELTRLRVLNISANRISRIGHGLANCTSLRELYLGANKISEVEGLHRLLKLNVLDLSHNKVTASKALNQLAANYQSLQALNLVGNGVCANLGEEQLRKFVVGIAPHVSYLNKQPLKSVHGREAVMDSVAKAALGSSTVRHAQRGTKPSTKSAKKGGLALQQQLPPGHKRSVSGDPTKIGLVPSQLSKSQGNLVSLRPRQGHGHHSRQQGDRPGSKEKRSADSSPLFQFESLAVVPDSDPVMLRIQSDSALNLQDRC